jgi:hypothetical protein
MGVRKLSTQFAHHIWIERYKCRAGQSTVNKPDEQGRIMFDKWFRKSKPGASLAATLYSFDNFYLYADLLSRQHNVSFKIVSLTDMMKIVNGIQDDEIPEVLYIEANSFRRQPRGSIKSAQPHHPPHSDDIETIELYEEDDNELDISIDQEEPFVLVKQSKSLPTLVMPTKLINELKEYARFKKTEKSVHPKENAIDTQFEVLDDPDNNASSSQS